MKKCPKCGKDVTEVVSKPGNFYCGECDKYTDGKKIFENLE